ncbi:potassium channel family protein [Mariniluteicoccus flavus]
MTEPTDHIVVIGSSTTAVRLVEELERAGEQVYVIAVAADPGIVEDMQEFGAEVDVVTKVRNPELERAGVRRARAAVVLGFDDVVTTQVALALEELNPELRLVLELANPNFSDRLGALLGECVVLSSAELAAPSFMAATMEGGDLQTFELAGRVVTAGPESGVGGDRLAVLGDSTVPGIEGVLPARGDIVLGTQALASARRHVRTSGVWGAITSVFDRRLRWVLFGLAVLMLVSVLYFRFVGGQTWLMSMYLALTASTLTGIGDTELPIGARFGAVVIQLFGVVLSSGITAVIVDALIKARLGDLTGGVRGRPRHHTVVCGLGRIGTSVMTYLVSRGVPVVAIERREDTPGVLRARRLKVPVIIAEATDATALEQAGIAEADAVVALTDNDAANLEIALVAKNTRPEVRVVTRLFDHDLAGRVERRLALGPTRSVSMVAAPAFAAAAMGRRKEVVFSVGRRVLIFTELSIKEGSLAADGVDHRALARAGEVRVLAVKHADGDWTWSPDDRPVRAGDRVAVVATRSGLAELLKTIKRHSSSGGPA